MLNAMLPAVPGIVGRVIRASRAAIGTFGARRGVTGAGVSANEANADVQAAVIGHLWEQIRCFPLRRRHHVAANLVFDTQRAALHALGVDVTQAAAEVATMDDVAVHQPLAETPAEKDPSEELLELLSWAVEQRWLDEQEWRSCIQRVGVYVGGDKMINAPHSGSLVRIDILDLVGYAGGVSMLR